MKKIIALLVLGLSACRSLPDLTQRQPSYFIPSTDAPRLEKAFNLHIRPPEPNNNNADLYVLDSAYDAFAARAALIDYADKSIDLQYYIWRNDVSGRLLLRHLWQAAQRGVRVRLLLDDNNTSGNDKLLFNFDAHPNIQVRLFNPFLYRKLRFVNYLIDFKRLNHRMHNKSFVVDNRAAIIGGRNIGDEYFSRDADTVFSDMDVLIAGDVVTQVSQDFDRYWQSASAYPLKKIISPQKMNLDEFTQPFTEKELNYIKKLNYSHFYQNFQKHKLQYFTAPVHLLSDEPIKALAHHHGVSEIGERIDGALQMPKQEIYLVSPYFVPTDNGLNVLRHFVNNGVHITVLTNSLRATDVAAVHSGYARYRKPLLQAGVKLYEFKPDRAVSKTKDKGLTGNAINSLHAKTFIIDKKRIFIGSLNLDPRSAYLNTEMGLVIDSPPLANQMQQKIQHESDTIAYQVTLDKQDKMQWRDPETGKISHREPEAHLWKRMISKILSFLPIERLL